MQICGNIFLFEIVNIGTLRLNKIEIKIFWEPASILSGKPFSKNAFCLLIQNLAQNPAEFCLSLRQLFE